MPSQVETIRKFIILTDGGNIDEAMGLVTDDFIYKTPKVQTQLGSELEQGLDIPKFKEYHGIIKRTCSNLTTAIESTNEEGNVVHIKGTTTYVVNIPETEDSPARSGTEETSFETDYTFSDGKICRIEAGL